MEAQLEAIRDQQKETWNKFSPGWKTWDDLTMDFLKPFGDEIIRQLNLKENNVVLDVAAGTGEPGLTIAAKLKAGKVIITDLADDMLVLAREKAIKKGLINVEFSACDVTELPFKDNTFDAISCRFGFMFFPDILMAAQEMVRVLKPGGRIAIAIWNGPEKNFWITATSTVMNKHLEMPVHPPGSPGMFRCAPEGLMTDLFTKAGFKNVTQKEVEGRLNTETSGVYWNFMTSVAANVVAALGKTDDATKEVIRKEVFQTVNQKYSEGKVSLEASALIISGQK